MSSDPTTPRMTVDCAMAREAMEIAAVEPNGLDLLTGTPPADLEAIASHVSGCADCSAELARLREIATILGQAIAPTPPADLRARTLALVAEVGRDRSAAGLVPAATAAGLVAAGVAPGPVAMPAATAAPAAMPVPADLSCAAADRVPSAPRAFPSRRPARTRVAVGVLALAATFVLAIGGTALVVGSITRSDVAAERARNAELAATAESALRLMADPAAIHIPMRDGVGSAVGMAVVIPRTYDATVVAVGLPEPPVGHEYACYIVLDGQRVLVGRMEDGGATYAWVGTIDALAGVAPEAVGGYGVMLVPTGSTTTEGTPVLSGSL